MFLNIFKDINNLSDVNHGRGGGIRRRTGDTKMAIVVILIFSMSGSRHSKHFSSFYSSFNLLLLWFSISLDYSVALSFSFSSMLKIPSNIKVDKILLSIFIRLRGVSCLQYLRALFKTSSNIMCF